MKPFSVYLFLLLVATGACGQALPGLTFGGPWSDDGYQIEATADGGFAVAGHTYTGSGNDLNFWLLRFDAYGYYLWDSTYGYPGYNQLLALRLAGDGSFLLAGLTGNFGSGQEAALLYRIDTSGHPIWSKTIDYTAADHAHILLEDKTGGYYMAGHTDSRGDPSGDVWVVRMDSTTQVMWDTVFGPSTVAEHAHSAVVTPDSGLLVLAHTNDAGFQKFRLIKVSTEGTEQWTRTYSSHPVKNDIPYHIARTPQGHYAMFGTSEWSGSTTSMFWLLVVDSVGNILVDKHYGTNAYNFCWHGLPTADGGFLMTGYTNRGQHGGFDLLAIKTDSMGRQIWYREIGGIGNEVGYAATQLPDGRYVLTGSTNTNTGALGDQLWVLALDTAGVPAPFHSVNLDASLQAFQPTGTSVCGWSFEPFIHLENKGTDSLFSVQLHYQADSGITALYQWSGALASGAADTVYLPPVAVNLSGEHVLTVSASMPNGQPDANPGNDEVTISFLTDTLVENIPYQEGFETGQLPPLHHTAADEGNMMMVDFGGGYGTSQYSLQWNFYNTSPGFHAFLVTPPIRLPAFSSSVQLTFDYAYALRDTFHQADSVKFWLSDDCGMHWLPLLRTGGQAMATSFNHPAVFIPGPQDWQTRHVDLSAYSGSEVQIRIEGSSGNGNLFYLDNLNIDRTNGLADLPKAKKFRSYPNPADQSLWIAQPSPVERLTVGLYTADGVCVRTLQTSEPITRMELSRLPEGCYFVTMATASRTEVHRIVIIH